MTTPWQPNNEWAGATVAVLASGPSMNADVAEALREHRTIVVNLEHNLAPWADMLVALDGNWAQPYREFAGLRVTGVADDGLDALYVGPMWERVRLSPSHEIEFRNSGLAAIRIAAGMGASRIILAGFEPEARSHFYDDEEVEYVGLAEGIAALTTELQARGIAVERFALPAEVAPAAATAPSKRLHRPRHV
jgi:hypothetical protein